jgi:predicted small lipoprotein YifL
LTIPRRRWNGNHAGLSSRLPAANAGELPVDRRFLRRAFVVAAIVAAMGVSGCGRKGPLDAPSAAVKPATDTSQPADSTKTSDVAKPNKSFVLDPLLN